MQCSILSCGLVLLLAGCSASEYAGISFAPGAAPPDLQQLAQRAEGGDKRALFELGIRFEEGRGVPVDLARAEQLYAEAAAGKPVYEHLREVPVSKHGQSTVREVQIGMVPGLAEARLRLAALRRARAGN